MNQLFTIIKREVFVKIKAKSFYLFTLFSPILFLIPIITNMFNEDAIISKNLVVVNTTDIIIKDTIDYKGLKFFNINKDSGIENKHLLGIIDIRKQDIENFDSRTPIKFHLKEEDILPSKDKIKDVENLINQKILLKRAEKLGIKDSISFKLSKLKNVYPIIKHSSIEKSRKLATSISFILSMLVYISFILFNNSILKSVSEEKMNKLAEVLSVFVKPINLMSGKILGQGLASLIQVMLWIMVFLFYIRILSWVEIKFFSINKTVGNITYLQSSLEELRNLPIINIIVFLPLFFVLGFLLNGALSTIIAIYSNSKNMNYLMFISNIINIMSIYIGVYSATNPESSITKVSYYIPFFSYLTITTTLPFNLDINTIIISLLILVIFVLILFYTASLVYKKSFK